MPSDKTTLEKHCENIGLIWSGKSPISDRVVGLERIILLCLSVAMFLTPAMWVRHVGGWWGRKTRKIWVDTYAVIKLGIAIFILHFHWWEIRYVPILCTWLLVDLFITLAGYVFLRDYWQNPYSRGRSVMLLLVNFVEHTSWFACLYLSARVLTNHVGVVTSSREALYFSVVTAATVGYGDITPSPGAGHTLVMLEIFASLFFVATVVGYFVANMSVPEQDK